MGYRRESRLLHAAKNAGIVLTEAVRAFFRNNDPTAASSLSFFSTIALIPALFLLTYLNSFSEGLSHLLILKSRTVLEEIIPASSGEVLEKILSVSAPHKAIGIINLAILLWSITPLITSIRKAFSNIYKTRLKHIYFVIKLLDVLLVTGFIIVYAAVSTSGVLLKLLPSGLVLPFFETALPYFIFLGIVFISYMAFSPRTRPAYLLAGAFVATSIWFLMRPAFNVFLTYNAGFGFMFGSLKSIFIAVIWIYLSQCIYLFGAEVSASLRRREAVVIKRLMDGKQPRGVRTERSLLVHPEPGEIVLREGEDEGEMYYVRSGTVSIEKDGLMISTIGSGQFVGEMAFLLSKPRSANVRAGSRVELIRISHDNFTVLTREFPDIVENMLEQMARRLKDTTELVV